jgi:hypothetical protein
MEDGEITSEFEAGLWESELQSVLKIMTINEDV